MVCVVLLAGSWRLYMSRGELLQEGVLVEVPCSVRQLRSRASLVLLNAATGATFVWHGAKSQLHSRKVELIVWRSAAYPGSHTCDLHIGCAQVESQPRLTCFCRCPHFLQADARKIPLIMSFIDRPDIQHPSY
jgi:hypothetical protein